jgi:hypothetical protein
MNLFASLLLLGGFKIIGVLNNKKAIRNDRRKIERS